MCGRRIWVPFLLSRGLVLFSAVCVSQVVTQPWQVIPFPPPQDWSRLVRSVLFVADSGFYLGIVTDGYDPGPFSAAEQANWAFFPLYPALVKGLAWAVPLSPTWLGILLSNVALAGSLALLDQVTAADWGESAARTAVWLLAFFPTSYFLSGFRPEAVFLLVTLLAYREARRGRWWLAGLAGALASAARLQGVLLVAVLLFEGVRQHGWQWRRLLPVAGSVVLATGGLLAFMAYLWWWTGDPLAFIDIQAAWGREAAVPGQPLVAYVSAPYLVAHAGWDLGVTNFPLTLLGLIAGGALLLQRQLGTGLYALGSLLLPLSTSSLLSAGRFAATIFPIYSCLALWLSRRRAEWRDGALASSAALLGLLSLLAALDINAAQG